ncbi:MAG: divergent polysaccharide deacetylase family protein [Candidatus Saccharicenans sp.]|jgi:polysaccharide deacetylase 2 family uncharacterized protein YibQ|nr:divergent polysaccharide deacetylase family protein [Candidatus Saccharicenans sp.]
MPAKSDPKKITFDSHRFFLKLSLILAFLALLSGLLLDYLSFRRQQTAYLPWATLTEHQAPARLAKRAEKKTSRAGQKRAVKLEEPAPNSSSDRTDEKTLSLVAIIIDDMGQDLNFMRELVNLKVPLTVAILPDAGQAVDTAQMAVSHQLEVIIHLPLEAFNGQTAGSGADGLITTTMSQEEIWARLEASLERLPVARGLNNHMGSKGTASQYVMEIIMEFLKQKNLFFIDSKTSSKSIAYDLALKRQVPAASRQVFLDADEDRGKIKQRLFELFTLARKNGQALGIGHPFEDTLRVLKTYLPEAKNYGVELATCSQLIKRQQEIRQKNPETD